MVVYTLCVFAPMQMYNSRVCFLTVVLCCAGGDFHAAQIGVGVIVCMSDV